MDNKWVHQTSLLRHQSITLLIYSSTYTPTHKKQNSNPAHMEEKKSSSSSSSFSSSSSETNEFEFGCIKPKSSSSDPERAVSPADEFFVNGRLLPHSFPERRSSSSNSSTLSSLVSTPRNSSSGSSVDAGEKKLVSKGRLVAPKQGINDNKKCSYGSTFQRWQIISISPSPSVSRRRRSSCGEISFKLSPEKKKMKECDVERGFCKRILRSFVKSCKACHAMEEGVAMEDHDLVLK